MVPFRYPVYVSVGLTVAAYGLCYGIVSGEFAAVVPTMLPGGLLAAHGLLNGVAAAVSVDEDTSDDDEESAGGRDEDEGNDGDPEDPSNVQLSPVEFPGRVPL